MHEIAILFAQVACVVVGMVAALAGIAIGTRALWKLTARVAPRDPLGVSPRDIQRIETAVESIAIEVERISEAQRFTVALLSDRMPAGEAGRRDVLVAAPGRVPVTTPH